jgi:hypothetical protein
MHLDVLAWTDELETRRARPRVTRFVLAIWDATIDAWFIEGRVIEGYGFHVPELQTDVYGVLDVPVGERIQLAIALIKNGRWIGYCPGLPGVIVDADTIDQLRREISRFVAMIPMRQLGLAQCGVHGAGGVGAELR